MLYMYVPCSTRLAKLGQTEPAKGVEEEASETRLELETH